MDRGVTDPLEKHPPPICVTGLNLVAWLSGGVRKISGRWASFLKEGEFLNPYKYDRLQLMCVILPNLVALGYTVWASV